MKSLISIFSVSLIVIGSNSLIISIEISSSLGVSISIFSQDLIIFIASFFGSFISSISSSIAIKSLFPSSLTFAS